MSGGGSERFACAPPLCRKKQGVGAREGDVGCKEGKGYRNGMSSQVLYRLCSIYFSFMGRVKAVRLLAISCFPPWMRTVFQNVLHIFQKAA